MNDCQDDFHIRRKSVIIFVAMNRNIIAIAAILLLPGIHAKAQFNTVSNPGLRYKVGVENPVDPNEKEATPESITSEKKKSVPDKVSLSGADTKKEEQVARNLSVCYPLSYIKVNSPYGYRKDPFSGKRKFHNGIDLYARSAKVYAMLQGKVIAVGQDKVSGKYVTLQHGNFTVSYCHLSQTSVSEGLVVKSGEVVGVSGNTGRSTGEHLHLSILHKGKYINPRIFLDYISSVKDLCVMELAQVQRKE